MPNHLEELTPPSGDDFAAASRKLRGEEEPVITKLLEDRDEPDLLSVTLTIVLVPDTLDSPAIDFLDSSWLKRWDGEHTEAAFAGTYEAANHLANCLTDYFGMSVSIVRHVDYDVGVLHGAANSLEVVDFVPGVNDATPTVDDSEEFEDGR